MPYQGKAVANAFITHARSEGIGIDPLKLQKLLYYANGYFMAENDGLPLVNEYFEAWDYGPVIPTVYYEFREYRNGPIQRYAYTTSTPSGERVIAPIPTDAKALEAIEWVWNNYKHFSGLALSNMTHKEGGPWDRARRRAANHGMRNERLDQNEINEHFRVLVEQG